MYISMELNMNNHYYCVYCGRKVCEEVSLKIREFEQCPDCRRLMYIFGSN